MSDRLHLPAWTISVLIAAALALSACGVNLSGEPEIRSEREIISLPTAIPATPTPAVTATAAPTTAPDATPDAISSPVPAAAEPETLVEADGAYDLGFEVYLRECAVCHGAADGAGPSLRTMKDNAAARVAGLSAEEYLRQSILEPSAFVVPGYADIMPKDFAGKLTEEELVGLITFVRDFDPSRMGMTGAPADPTPVATGETLTVQGRLVPGTASGEPIPEGLTVELYPVSAQGSILNVYQATSGADGSFEFTDVVRAPGTTYFIETDYQGVPQGTRITAIAGTETLLTQNVTLYERTTNPSAVVITWAEVLLNYAPINEFGVEVWLNLELANTGDRIVTTEEVSALNEWYVSVIMELPVAAFGIQPIQSANSNRFSVEEVDGVPVVKDTWPLRPGQVHTITVAYYLPYKDGALFEHAFDYPVVDGAVLVPNDTVSFSGEQFDAEGLWQGRVMTDAIHGGVRVVALEPNEKIDPDKDFTLVKAHSLRDPLPAGERMRFELAGRPTRTLELMRPAPGDDGSTSDTLILILAGAGLLMIAGSAALWWRGRRREAYVPGEARPALKPKRGGWHPPRPGEGKQVLLAALADLDDALKAGDLDEETYHERRAILTERLLPLLEEDRD